MSDAELYIYTNHRSSYVRIRRRINLLMQLMYKPCIGESCDIDYSCKRHSKATIVVDRYLSILSK